MSDILTYGATVDNPVIDGLVREIAKCPGYDAVSGQVAEILWHDWPHWQNVTTDYDRVLSELRSIREGLADPPRSSND